MMTMADRRHPSMIKSSIGTMEVMVGRKTAPLVVELHGQQQQQHQQQHQQHVVVKKPAQEDFATTSLCICENNVQLDTAVVNGNMEVDGTVKVNGHCDDGNDVDDDDDDVSQSFQDLINGSDEPWNNDSSHTLKRHNLWFSNNHGGGRGCNPNNDSNSSLPELMSFCHGSFGTSNNNASATMEASSSSSSSFLWNDALLVDSVPLRDEWFVKSDGNSSYLRDHRHHSPTSTLMMERSATPTKTPAAKKPILVSRSPYARQLSSFSSSSSSTSSCSRSDSRWEGGCSNDTVPSYRRRR